MKPASIREDWEGRQIDGRFHLLEWLGGSRDGGVFITELEGSQKAAIKLIAAKGDEAEALLAQLRATQSLSHPHLLTVHHTGRAVVGAVEVVYIVSDLADKALSHVLPEHPIQPGQAAGVLKSLLDVLSYLHAENVIHGNIKPSNLLFIGKELKLASDDFLVAGGVSRHVRNPGPYDAPEVLNGAITAAADSWSIGITLVEALTQRLPVWDWSRNGAPVVPEALPQPFYSIAEDCLRMEPGKRCTRNKIASLLDEDPIPVLPVDEAIRIPRKFPRIGLKSAQLPRFEAPPAEPIAAAAAAPLSISEVPAAAPPLPVETYAAPQSYVPRESYTPPEPEAPAFVPATPRRTPAIPAYLPPPPSQAQPTHFARSRWEDAEHFEAFSGPAPALFAHYEEAHSSKGSFKLMLLGGLVLLAAAGFVAVRSNKVSLSGLLGSHSASTAVQSPSATPSVPPATPATQPAAPSATSAQPQLIVPTAEPSSAAAVPSSTQSQSAQTQTQAPPASSQSQPAVASTAPVPTPSSASRIPATNPPAASDTASATPAPAVAAPVAKPVPASLTPHVLNSKGSIESRSMPEVSRAAIASMRRPVQVTVRLTVDHAGNVQDASYVSPGPGNYFARTAVRATKQWKFNPPVTAGRPESSVWIVRFDFGRSGTDISQIEKVR